MERFPKPISKHCTKKIFKQMDSYFYKIPCKNGNFIFGFFCFIKCENNNIPVLITDRQIINEISNNEIDISINKKIELGDIIYRNKKYDIAIIEIKKSMIKNLNFLDLDERIYEKNNELYSDKESIYIIHYNNDNKNTSVSYGTINTIKNSEIIYSCNINSKIKICPIFNISNNRIIGIHQFFSKYYNRGFFMNNIISEFIDNYKFKKNKLNADKLILKSKQVNEIQITIDIKNNKPEEKISFLNSKELNYTNTELYINNEKFEYKNYFKPTGKGIYDIILKFITNLKDCSYMFAGYKNIKNINFKCFNSEYITKMNGMFSDCQELESINLFSFKTKNVINMSHLFSNCRKLKYVDLSSFDTENVIDMSNMFNDCENLENLNLINFKTLNVTNMNNMFYNCKKLKSLDLSSFVTENVIDMSNIFNGCENIENLNLTNFKTIKVANMDNMFNNCNKLKNLDLSSFSRNKTSNETNIFNGCKQINDLLDLSYFDTHIINNAFEFVIEFISLIKKETLKDYLFNKIKNIKFFGQKEFFLKFKHKIILTKDNKKYILNLLNTNFGNKPYQVDLRILEYDINDKKSYKDIKSLLKKEDINKINFNYLIGINDETGNKFVNSETKKFSDINKIKQMCISSKNVNEIKILFNDILMNLDKVKFDCVKRYEVILLAGSIATVGKTSLIHRIIDNTFSEKPFMLTSGVSSFQKIIPLKNGKNLNLYFNDTHSGDSFRGIVLNYVKRSDCAILIYDVTNRDSFNKLEIIYEQMMSFKKFNLVYLIANKIDKIKKSVDEEEAIKFVQKYNLRYFKISCKDNLGIKDLLLDLIN